MPGSPGSSEDKGREAVEAALSTVALTLRGLAPRGSVGFALVKTFEELHAELVTKWAEKDADVRHRHAPARGRRARDRQEGRRGGRRGLDGGRVRGQGACGRGDLPAALLHPGAHARGRTCPSRTSTGICDPSPASRSRAPAARSSRMLRVALPNKGQLVRPRPRDAARGGLPRRAQRPRARRPGPRERRRVLLPASARHRHLRRQRASSTSASPGSTSCSTPASRPRRCSSSASRRSTFRFAAPAGHGVDRAGPRRACASPRRTPGCSRTRLAELGIEATVVKLDGAVENSVRLGVADAVADVVATGTTLQAGGPRACSASRCW